MDSPLLPQMKRAPNPDTTTSPSAFISNLSLGDDTEDSFALAQSQQRASSSQSGRVPSDQHDADDWGEETPQKAVPQPKSKPRFSLFAPPQPSTSSSSRHPQQRQASQSMNRGADELETGDDHSEHAGGVDEAEEEDQTIHPTSSRQDSAQRDEKLRESLYELRQMNEVFDGFLNALEAARGHNERLAQRVKQTSQLLDQYTALLGQTEHTQNLILNPKWTGAQDDAAAVAAEEAERIAAEEAAVAEQVRRAEELRLAEEEKERQASEAARLKDAGTGRGGARGRGTRGLGRGSGIPPPTRGRVPLTTASGLRKPSGGLSGQYANVKSSGYGPKKTT